MFTLSFSFPSPLAEAWHLPTSPKDVSFFQQDLHVKSQNVGHYLVQGIFNPNLEVVDLAII